MAISEEHLERRLREHGDLLRDEMAALMGASEARQRLGVDGLRESINATLEKMRQVETSNRKLGERVQRLVDEQDDKIDQVRRDVGQVLTVLGGMREDLYGDPTKRSGPAALYERIEQLEQGTRERIEQMEANSRERFDQVEDALALKIDTLGERIDTGERWMARREAVEKALIAAAKAPAVILMKKVLPFVAGVGLLGTGVLALYGMMV